MKSLLNSLMIMRMNKTIDKNFKCSTLMEIYTDGSCLGNPGPGGWGAYLEYKGTGLKSVKKEIFGCSHETTNNQMEVLAAIEALKILKKP